MRQELKFKTSLGYVYSEMPAQETEKQSSEMAQSKRASASKTEDLSSILIIGSHELPSNVHILAGTRMHPPSTHM